MSLALRKYCIDNQIPLDNINRTVIRDFYFKPTSRNEDGSRAYVTQQMHKDECDINLIIKRYPIRVTQARMAMAEAIFADVTGSDFQKSINLVRDTEREFLKLDPEIRSKFNNNPAEYLDYLAQPTKAADTIKDEIPKPQQTKGKEKTDAKLKEIQEDG